ncbi:hypothetical protein FPV67DRAFT_1674149 [Lyophyllum atratum]|nr:hypothetical protein FPV67DRAFT_1674149 [Lyophyllum atratum]
MADISIKDISRLSEIHPRLTLHQVMQFVTLARSLKDDILLTQPAVIPASDPPEILPPSVKTFLEDSCKISEECVEDCWEVLRSTIWHGVGVNREQDFVEHGHPRGLTSRTLYPPCQTCSNFDCSRNKKGQLLKKAEQRQAVLYTLGEGALPVYTVHLYCESCNVNYHHNYSVKKDKRTYYDGIPEIIQVGEHQFMEQKLVQLYMTMMLVSWTSATNCARMYNLTLSNTVPPDDWAFGFTVTTEHVWDAFVILSLMEDFERRSKTLVIPHTGAQKDCFTNALQERNIRFRLYSQPELIVFVIGGKLNDNCLPSSSGRLHCYVFLLLVGCTNMGPFLCEMVPHVEAAVLFRAVGKKGIEIYTVANIKALNKDTVTRLL